MEITLSKQEVEASLSNKGKITENKNRKDSATKRKKIITMAQFKHVSVFIGIPFLGDGDFNKIESFNRKQSVNLTFPEHL